MRLLSLLLSAAAMLAASEEAGRAGCTDAAAPGVVWRRCLLDGSDLRGANLDRAVLADSSLKRADLSGAVLTGIEGRRVKMVSTTLSGANLDQADLSDSDLTLAVARGASLKGANLRRAKLYRTDLRDADLTGASLDGADLLHAELSGARWTDGHTICAEGSTERCRPTAEGATQDHAAKPAAGSGETPLFSQ